MAPLMRAGWLLLAAAVGAGCVTSSAERPATPAAPQPANPPDVKATTAELQAFLDAQATDWTEGDLEGFCAVYAEDAVFISPSGKTVGRQAIFDRYTKRYREGGAKMGALTLTVDDVRLSPSGDMAAIAMRWSLTWERQDPASGLSLITLVKQGPPGADGERSWQIVQDASM
jgi:uncharacterized protein (TIGR02246 family)